LEKVHRDPVFDAQPCATLVVDTDFTIRAVNKAYLTATGRSDEELINVHLFEAFPDNPDDPEADGVANLTRSLERAARSRLPHNMLVQRYDIADKADGGFLRRYWSPVNTPVLDEGRVIGILHRVEDITPLQDGLRRVIEDYRDILAAHPLTDAHAERFAESARSFAASAANHQSLVDEVMHLRRALTSRSTIEQAKGIIMAERRCSPEEAFQILAKLSQDTNVKVADVAAALVYKSQGPSTRP
jgi:PAS domain S-box-containing protein